MSYQPPLPNSSRLIDWGHSWVAPPANPYGTSDISQGGAGLPTDGEQWPFALRDALGIGSLGSYVKTYQIPAIPQNVATTTTTFAGTAGALSTLATLTLGATVASLGLPSTGQGVIECAAGIHTFSWTGTGTSTLTGCVYSAPTTDTVAVGGQISLTVAGPVSQAAYCVDLMAGDGTIDAAFFIPAGNAAAGGTNSRIWELTKGASAATAQQFGSTSTTGGMTAGVLYPMFQMNIASGTTGIFGQATIDSPYTPALAYTPGATAYSPQSIWLTSVPAGLGKPDPGGTLIIRYGTRYRNYGVAGSTLMDIPGGVNQYGSWWTCFSHGAWSRPNATEVNVVTGHAVGSGVSITVSPLQYPLAAGTPINFSGGITMTPTGATAFGATTITGTIAGGTIAAGAQGHYRSQVFGNTGLYESLSPVGVNVMTHGVNDCNSTQDTPAWTETSRAFMARCSVAAIDYANQGNFTYTGAGWGNVTPLAGGHLPYAFDNFYAGNDLPVSQVGTYKVFTGAPGTPGTQTCAIQVGPAFEGGNIDLFFLALAGSSLGVDATVTATGYSGIINSSAVSTTGLLNRTVAGTITAAGTTVTGTSTNFSASDLGKVLIPASGTYSPATIITAVASATSITVSTTVTVTGVACSVSGYVPMVKRITGLAAGAQTITIAVQSSDSTANSALFLYGMGIEPLNPATPVLWCNIARCPAQNGTQTGIAVAYNAASAAVINGTASIPTPASGSASSAEPAFASNVQYVDIDTPFGGASPNAAYFLPDGIHPNSKGHRLMSRTLFSVIRNNFSPDQLISR